MNGAISISRPSNQDDEDNPRIVISVRDSLSRIKFLELEITASLLTQALTGLAECPVKFKLKPENVGKKHEIKSVTVPWSRPSFTDASEALERAALSPFEVDGWRGRVEDLYNHKNFGKGDTCRVSFHRYVTP